MNSAETLRGLCTGILCVLCAGIPAAALADDPPQPTPGNVFRAGETAVIDLSTMPPSERGGAQSAGGSTSGDDQPVSARNTPPVAFGDSPLLEGANERKGVRWRVLDVDGATLAKGEAQGNVLTLPHSAIGGRLGAFTLHLDLPTTQTPTNPAPIRFAFLPPGDVHPCHWVGTQFHYWRHQWGRGDVRLLDLAAAAGIGIVRDEPSWAYCEKTPGQYEMSPFHEELVDGLVKRGMKFLCLLTFDNPGAYPDNPLDADAFARWAAWMADHLKGRCDTFEIFNEPHNFRFWKQYGPLYGCTDRRDPRWIRHFTDFTRTVDDALAGRGLRVGVGSEDWPDLLYTMLEQGIARPHNIVTIHPYDHRQPFPERAGWLRDGFADLRRRITASFNTETQSHRDTGSADETGASESPSLRDSVLKTPAIAITEVGWTTYDNTRDATHAPVGNYPPSTFAEQAERIVRMYLIARQAGAEFVCQYDFKDDGLKRNHTEDNFGLLDYWGHPKPSYAAVAAMTRLVGHAEPEGLVEGIDPAKIRIYRFRRDDGSTVFAAWAVEDCHTIDFNAEAQRRGEEQADLLTPNGVREDVSRVSGEPIRVTSHTEQVPLRLCASAIKNSEAYDLFGNPIEPPIRDGVLHLTSRPVYLIVTRQGDKP